MLVLALQFSKGAASTPEPTTARSGQGLKRRDTMAKKHSHRRGSIDPTAGEPLLQNGRERNV